MRQLMIVFVVCAVCLSVVQASKKDKKAGLFFLKIKGKGMQNMYANNYGGGGYSSGGYSGGYGGQQSGYGGYQQGGYGGQYGQYQSSYPSQPTIIPVFYPMMVPSYHQQSEHVGGYSDSSPGYGQTSGRNIGINIYPAQALPEFPTLPSSHYMGGYNVPHMYSSGYASGGGHGGFGNGIGGGYSSGGY